MGIFTKTTTSLDNSIEVFRSQSNNALGSLTSTITTLELVNTGILGKAESLTSENVILQAQIDKNNQDMVQMEANRLQNEAIITNIKAIITAPPTIGVDTEIR